MMLNQNNIGDFCAPLRRTEGRFLLYMCTYNNMDLDQKTVFCDKKANGKVQSWKEKKLMNVGYFELLGILWFKQAERVFTTCGEILKFDMTHERRMRLAKA